MDPAAQPPIMGAAEIRRRLGVSKKWADIQMRSAGWPEPYARLEMGRVWRVEDVEAWIAEHRPRLARPTEVPSPGAETQGTALPDIIQARIESALLHHERAGIEALDVQRGLATGGPDAPVIRLTIADVARIAAHAVDET